MYLCISTQPTWQSVIIWAIFAGSIAYFLKMCFEFAKLEKEHKYSLDKKQQKELNQKEETEKSLIKQLNEKVKALEKNANDTKEIEKTKIELLKYAFEKSDDENDKKEYLEKLTALIKQ